MSFLRTQNNDNDTMKNNKTILSFSLFQWMVGGQTGLRGHHVVPHAEMEHSRERGNVQTHRRPTAEQDVQAITQTTKPVI